MSGKEGGVEEFFTEVDTEGRYKKTIKDKGLRVDHDLYPLIIGNWYISLYLLN